MHIMTEKSHYTFQGCANTDSVDCLIAGEETYLSSQHAAPQLLPQTPMSPQQAQQLLQLLSQQQQQPVPSQLSMPQESQQHVPPPHQLQSQQPEQDVPPPLPQQQQQQHQPQELLQGPPPPQLQQSERDPPPPLLPSPPQQALQLLPPSPHRFQQPQQLQASSPHHQRRRSLQQQEPQAMQPAHGLPGQVPSQHRIQEPQALLPVEVALEVAQASSALEAPAAMLWCILRCLCCSRGLQASLRSWAATAGLASGFRISVSHKYPVNTWSTHACLKFQYRCVLYSRYVLASWRIYVLLWHPISDACRLFDGCRAVPGQEPDMVAGAVLRLIMDPGFAATSATTFVFFFFC